MATIRRFEDLEAWKRARALSKFIYGLSRQGTFSKDYALKDQINRSSGSVMDNVAEGFDRDGNREFIQMLTVSKGSLSETKSQIYRAFDRDHIPESIFDTLISDAEQTGKIIGGLILYLQRSPHSGNKFKRPNLDP